MEVTFKINEGKAVGYTLKFDDTDKINGRQGLLIIAQYIIDSLGDN
jgi:hypothetical protein